jgi:hypothetical protein
MEREARNRKWLMIEAKKIDAAGRKRRGQEALAIAK